MNLWWYSRWFFGTIIFLRYCETQTFAAAIWDENLHRSSQNYPQQKMGYWSKGEKTSAWRSTNPATLWKLLFGYFGIQFKPSLFKNHHNFQKLLTFWRNISKTKNLTPNRRYAEEAARTGGIIAPVSRMCVWVFMHSTMVYKSPFFTTVLGEYFLHPI